MLVIINGVNQFDTFTWQDVLDLGTWQEVLSYTWYEIYVKSNNILMESPTPETSAIISNGVIRLCQHHGIYIDSTNPVMVSNVFFDVFGKYTASSCGVLIVNGYGHSVMNSNIFGNSQGTTGIAITNLVQSCRVEGNNIQNCTYSTIWTDSIGSIITGNRLFGQDVTGSSETNTIANNRYTAV
ncbi:MAG: hypothetical protein WC343_14240 [Bacilli bacterium]|jgi:hypothetical protein